LLSSSTPKPTRESLDALSISPFLVIDENTIEALKRFKDLSILIAIK